jgi:hypothetical protein
MKVAIDTMTAINHGLWFPAAERGNAVALSLTIQRR